MAGRSGRITTDILIPPGKQLFMLLVGFDGVDAGATFYHLLIPETWDVQVLNDYLYQFFETMKTVDPEIYNIFDLLDSGEDLGHVIVLDDDIPWGVLGENFGVIG